MYTNYVASLSCGKDSLAMVLRLIEEGRPLTHVVMFDTGTEYGAIYNNLRKIKLLIEDYGAELTVLHPANPWWYDMLLKPVNKGKTNEHYGFDWGGG